MGEHLNFLFFLALTLSHPTHNLYAKTPTCLETMANKASKIKPALLSYEREIKESHGTRLLIKKAKEITPPQRWRGFLTEHKKSTQTFREHPFKRTGAALMDTVQLPVRGITRLTIGKQYELSPINGPLKHMTRKLSEKNKIFSEEKQFTHLSYWPLVFGSYSVLPDFVVNTLDAIDPLYHIIQGLFFAVEAMNEAEEEEELKLLIKNDPRFENIRAQLKDGKITSKDIELAKYKVKEIQDLFEVLQFMTPLPSSDADYKNIENLLKQKNSSKEISPAGEQILARLQLLEHPLYSHLLQYTDPSWIERKKLNGFNVDTTNFKTIDISTLDGLKLMDRLILERTQELAQYDFIKELTKNKELPEDIKANPQAAQSANEIKKQDFYKYVYQLREEKKINEGEMLEALLLWNNFRLSEKHNKVLGVFLEDEKGLPITLQALEQDMKAGLEEYILESQASKQ